MSRMNDDLKKEYHFKGSKVGCLIIHGFSSTPAELRELGERLNSKGHTVLGVRLSGHGTKVEDMEKCQYIDWINSVEEGYKKLKENCTSIYVVGHSMGALLALCLSEKYKVDKIVLLSPALVTATKVAKFVPLIKHFMRYTQWEEIERPEAEMKYLLGYGKIPLKSIHELGKLQKFTRKKLNKINSPILIVCSNKDTAIGLNGISIIADNVSTKEVKKVYLNKCGHNITVECEKETVFTEVLSFL